MTDYILDAHAWIEYLIGSEKGEKINKIIEDPNNNIFTSLITLSEIISITKRENRDYEQAYKHMLYLSKLTGLSPEFSMEVGLLHADIKKRIKDFGLADTFVLAAARKLNAKVITGDKHFKGIKEAIII